MSARLSVRLARLLNMVPFFMANPGLSAEEAARELGGVDGDPDGRSQSALDVRSARLRPG